VPGVNFARNMRCRKEIGGDRGLRLRDGMVSFQVQGRDIRPTRTRRSRVRPAMASGPSGAVAGTARCYDRKNGGFKMEVGVALAILRAYREVVDASWPTLHPDMDERAPLWDEVSESDLGYELAGYLSEASMPHVRVRVFWKLGPRLAFGGCNAAFARDAGFADPAALVGVDDFDPRLPWTHQAAKYRADDKEVMRSRRSQLDIIERQTQTSGEVHWVRAGKAPIFAESGEVIGILGMYEILADDEGRRLFLERLQKT